MMGTLLLGTAVAVSRCWVPAAVAVSGLACGVGSACRHSSDWDPSIFYGCRVWAGGASGLHLHMHRPMTCLQPYLCCCTLAFSLSATPSTPQVHSLMSSCSIPIMNRLFVAESSFCGWALGCCAAACATASLLGKQARATGDALSRGL